MKNLTITIVLTVKGDLNDEETLRQDVYDKIHGLIEEEALDFDAEESDLDDGGED